MARVRDYEDWAIGTDILPINVKPAKAHNQIPDSEKERERERERDGEARPEFQMSSKDH